MSMGERKKPKVQPPVKMEAALAVYLSVDDHYEYPGEYDGRAAFYFDEHRSINYRTRWKLKTQAGAVTRLRREAIEYLQALRSQIDEVLPLLETAELNEHDSISVYSSVYEQPTDEA